MTDGQTRRRPLYGEVDPRSRRRLIATAQAAAWLAVAGGTVGLAGRVFGLPVLAQWIPRLEVRPLQPATAVLMLLGGLAVLGALIRTGPWARRLGLFAAVLVTLGGAAVIVANLADLDFPRWLLHSLMAEDVIGGEQAARPALNEGIVTAAGGFAVILMTTRSATAHVVGQLVAIAMALVGATVVVAFAYGDDSLRGFPIGTGRMAIAAALLTILFCGSVAIARPSLGIMAPIISPWPGGIVLRRLLPVTLAGPPVGVAFLLGSTTPSSQPRLFAAAAVLASGLLMAALFATAAAVSRATSNAAVAEDMVDRATVAVGRDAGIVKEMLFRLSRSGAAVEGFDVAVRYRPAEGWLAGDSVLTLPLDDTRLAAILVDVVGHGPAPALAASRLSDVLQHTLRYGAGPAEAIGQAGWVLDEPQMMASVTVAELEARTGAVLYASAGSPPIIHRTPSNLDLFESTGPVLVAGESGSWHDGKTVLDQGDALILFSDGLADPTQPEGVVVATVEHLLDALRRCPYGDADKIADWCVAESIGQAEGLRRDDASLIVIVRTRDL